MDYQTIVCRKENNLMIIELFIFEIDGTGISELAYELSDIFHSIKSDNSVWAVSLICSSEKSLLPGIAKNETELNIRAGSDGKRSSIAEPISRLYQPVILAINGDLFGQGLEMALACDIRIVTKTSQLGFSHIKKGMIPCDGGTQRLARLVGKAKAMELILTGETIDAQEAYRVGLVNKVVPSPELMTVAMDMAQEMASKGPISLEYAKEAINNGMDLNLEQGLRLESDLYYLIQTTRDRTEGIRAFQEKRKAQFKRL